MMVKEEAQEKFYLLFWQILFLVQFFRGIFVWPGDPFLEKTYKFILYFNTSSFFISLFFFLSSRKKDKKIVLLLLFVSFAFFSIIWSVDKEITLFQSLFSLTLLFSSAFVSLSFKKPKEFLLKVINLVSFLGLFSSLFALFLLFFGEIEFHQNLFFNTFSFGRLVIFQLVDPSYIFWAPHSLFNNKNYFAFFLSLSAFFTFFLYFFYKRKIYLLSFLVQFLTLLSTYSRASVISFFTFLLLFFFFLFTKKEKNYPFHPILIFALLFYFFLLFFFLDPQRWLSYINQGLNKRTDLWKTGLKAWSESPFWGKGFGSAYHVNLERNNLWFSFHNTFLNILAELGIIGLSFFLFLWFLPLKVGLDTFRKEINKENIVFLSFLLAYQGGVLVQDLFETRIFYHFTFPIWASFTFILLNPFLTSFNLENNQRGQR